MDLAVEVARRQKETQIPPLRQAQETVPYAAKWMRIAFMQFLSNESDLWESKILASGNITPVERFCGILKLTVAGADKTRSAIPYWVKERLKTA